MIRRLVALITLAALALVPTAAAATAPGAVFGLRAVGNPKLGYFVFDLAPGASRTGAVIISNTGTRTGTVRLYPADAGTGQTTGTVYLTDKHASGAGTWVKLAASSLTLAPGAFRRVPFTVHAPKGAKPGQWVGGIVAETLARSTTKRTKRKAGVQIRIRNQTIVAVEVDVPGPLAANFRIGEVATGGQRGFQQVLVHLANTGNALVKPTGAVVIVKAGALFERLPFRMDTFLPQTSIDYPLLLTKALGPGKYQARVSLSFPGAGGSLKRVNGTRSFSVSDTEVKQVFTSAAPTKQPTGGVVASGGSSRAWLFVVAVLAAAALLALFGWAILRRRRTEPADAEPAATATPAAPVEPAAPTSDPEQPSGVPRGETCRPFHHWDVGYDHGTLDDEGVWHFPHRCRNCGLELTATDTADASAQADAIAP